MKTIAIDNGHGKFTAGKRTPAFPNGQQIREWEFNYPTAKKVGHLLKHNGFKVIYVSDTENDTPLRTRTDRANSQGVDLYVSIHYNALTGRWGSQNGIETFYWKTSNEGKRLAKLIQSNLIQFTGLHDRGIKTSNLHVLRETRMTSILVECGFMDNLKEANLMLDESYQWKCAKAIVKGICEYYNQPFKDNEQSDKSTIKIKLHGEPKVIEGFKKDRVNYVPIRFLEQLGYKIGWDDKTETVLIGYKG